MINKTLPKHPAYNLGAKSRMHIEKYMRAPNGMNFSKSVKNPNSNLRKVLSYLAVNGPRSKSEILQNVFGRVYEWRPGYRQVKRGWGSSMFGLARRCGFLTCYRESPGVVKWKIATQDTPAPVHLVHAALAAKREADLAREEYYRAHDRRAAANAAEDAAYRALNLWNFSNT